MSSSWSACLGNQSLYLERLTQAFEAARPALVACLADYGLDIPLDATRDEFESAALQLLLTEVVSEPTCVPPG